MKAITLFALLLIFPVLARAAAFSGLPPDVASLPYVRGWANVPDLRSVMVQNPRLKNLVAEFARARDVNAADQMLDPIILEWTDSNAIEKTSRGYHMDARYLNALEKFVGEPFRYNNGGNAPSLMSARILMKEYSRVRAFVRSQLLAQTLYGPEFGLTITDYDPNRRISPTNIDTFTRHLETLHKAGHRQKVVDLYCTLAAFDLLEGYAPSFSENLRSHPVLSSTINTVLDTSKLVPPKAWASMSPDARSGNRGLSLGCLDLLRLKDLLAAPPPVGEDISSLGKQQKPDPKSGLRIFTN